MVPSSTSWCATIPRIRTEWIRIPAGPSPPRAPSTVWVTVGSGAQSRLASAIRSAGEAITVNYKSVTEPIVITAIGDDDVLQNQWEQGPSGRYLVARADADGIRFGVRGSVDGEMRAAPESRLKVSAEPLRRSAS